MNDSNGSEQAQVASGADDADKAAKETAEPQKLTFKEFLEGVPPSQWRRVTDAWSTEYSKFSGTATKLSNIAIELHCSSDICNGPRLFRVINRPSVEPGKRHSHFVNYVCSNCRSTSKLYSLVVVSDESPEGGARCYKYGEEPPYGPPTSSRLISLIGPDKESYLKGRQCEIHGQGIGAFAYYRRVVENQKNRILDRIISVAEKLSAPVESVDLIRRAKNETQFSNAIDSAKDALPKVLFIRGHNPLTLLHTALSKGLHEQSDEACLEIAHDIRLVLGELSERLAQSLKDEKEIGDAVARLAKSRQVK